MTDLAAQISSLSERLRTFEDERAIMATLHQYGHAIDYGDLEGWLDCFTGNGSFDIQNRLGPRFLDDYFGALIPGSVKHPLGIRFEGRQDLGAFFGHHTHAPVAYHKHYVIEPRISVDGDGAAVDSYFIVMHEIRGLPQITGMGRYRDRMIRDKDGKWRIRERVSEMEAFNPPV